MMIDDLAPDVKAALAAFFGSLVSFKFIRGMTLWQKLVAIACGCIMAYFMSASISSFFGNAGVIGAVGFLTGLFGISICDKLYNYINAGLIDDIRARLRG